MKIGDEVIFIKNYKDTIKAGEVLKVDKMIENSVYIKHDTGWVYLTEEKLNEYCKPYKVTKVVSVSMSTQEELKKMRDIECKIINEIIKKAEKQMEKDMKEYDYINPNHYKQGGKEVIEMMVDIWGAEDVVKYCEMNAFKYRMRMGLKPNQPIAQELEKAKWYEDKAKELRDGKK